MAEISQAYSRSTQQLKVEIMVGPLTAVGAWSRHHLQKNSTFLMLNGLCNTQLFLHLNKQYSYRGLLV